MSKPIPVTVISADFSKLEERVLARCLLPRSYREPVVSSLTMGFTPTAYIPATGQQFVGRVVRKNVADKRSKAQHKLDAASYELKKIKANFDLEASLAYRSFLAGVVHNQELCAVATNLQPSHIGRNWYKELLVDLGYAPHQLKLPTPEAK